MGEVRRRRDFLILTAGVCLAPPAPTQQPPAARFRVDSYAGLLEVRVLDSNGRFLSGLRAGDFEIRAGGGSRRLLAFQERPDEPLSLAVLIDVGVPMDPEMVAEAKKVVLDLIHLLDREDEIAIGVYDAETDFLAELTSDRLELLKALEDVGGAARPGFWSRLGRAFAASGLTGPAIDEALLRLKRGRHEVRAVLVFSSAFGAVGQGTVEHLRISGARLFAVGWPNRTGDAMNLWGDRTSRSHLLKQGGGFFYSAEEVLEKVRELAGGMKNCYLIAYDPPEGDSAAEEAEVKVPSFPQAKIASLRRVAGDNPFY